MPPGLTLVCDEQLMMYGGCFDLNLYCGPSVRPSGRPDGVNEPQPGSQDIDCGDQASTNGEPIRDVTEIALLR